MRTWGRGTTGLRPCPDREAAGGRDNWPTVKVRVHPRNEGQEGALIRGSTWRRSDRKARALREGLDEIFRTVSQGVLALELCWVDEELLVCSLERGCPLCSVGAH